MNDLEKALAHKIVPWTEIQHRTKNYWVFKDGYPVNPGHQLFVPTNNNDMACLMECYEAAYKFGFMLMSSDKCNGFNVGQNISPAAGQTVNYPHVHMIPRFNGDMDDPTGGIRNVVPNMGNYKNPHKLLNDEDHKQLKETFRLLSKLWADPKMMDESATPLIRLERVLHKLGSQKHARLRS